ncbi:site-specific DNA-methyltransferase [Spiribacter vilamensis]|uniref:site-specific DNA-methyltransferase (adenine-specific) n=1 Tax=Spiribacter vilamensis TaxID=531306 RepID=A0A4Q8D0D5_9GAMM|nr:site-specific DNA-methyltransferase [Spiribacter vilamensis]RZU98722.1 adenine-specific DNA-methyltransferase [Spiribacter vilamensis]TVO62254.1 site-specific DNA-methyltransferase [Spiribacter vilamensis]
MDKLDPKQDGASPDIVQENIDKLRELFPDAFAEGSDRDGSRWKVDFDALRQILGDYVEDERERYSFSWHGKARARQIAQTPSAGTLRPCPEESVNWDTTQNLFIEGDNLEVLKLLQKSYHKQVKMIYIDPPYNTGGEFIYPDRFQDNLDTYLRYTGQIDDQGFKVSANSESSGRYHTNWLNMMYPRLRLARNLLRDDGIIFVSIDDNEIENLRKIMGEIFGEENEVACVVWQHSVQPKGYSGIFSLHHNYVLCFRKSDNFQLHSLPRSEEDNKNYSNPDDDSNGAWRAGDVRNALYRPNLIYQLTTPSGKTIDPPENGWRWSKEKMEEKIKSGEVVFSKDESRIVRKIYLYRQEGRPPESIWFARDAGTTRKASDELKALFDGKVPFDTTKPTSLILRMLQLAGVKDDDLCLDFFAGSGSTAHAVLNHQAGRFLMVQLPEPINEEVPHGKAAASLGMSTVAEVCRERVRRVVERIDVDNASEGASYRRDMGFKVLKLSASNIVPWDPKEDEIEASLFGSINSIKPKRTQRDVLHELLLKYGLDLAVPIKERDIAGRTVFLIGAGALVVCLADDVNLDVVKGIAALKDELTPEVMRVVFKDAGFADDVVKTNTVQILRQAGIEDVKSL